MLTRILAASILAFGLATSAAMAQSTATDRQDMNSVPIPSTANESIDTGTTGSILPGAMGMMGGSKGQDATQPCASAPGSMGPDANAQLDVNDHYCGK